MKLFFSIALLFAAITGFAQTKTIFYYKYNGTKVANADSADFIRVVTPPDSASTLFNVADFYTSGGVHKLLGKSTTIDPITLDGQCASFYLNGRRQAVVEYSNGTVLGTSYLYYPNGKLHAILNYDTLTTKNYDANFRVLSCSDSAGKPTVTDGNGHFVDYNLATGALSEEGNVKNGRPDGEWHGSYPADKVTYTDIYRDGQFISGYCVLANGTKYTYLHKVQSPQYPGGDAAFTAYLKKKVHYQQPAGKPGTKKKSVLMTFLVTRQGKPMYVRLLGSYNITVDKALINAAATSIGWKPSLQNGRPVDGPFNVALTL